MNMTIHHLLKVPYIYIYSKINNAKTHTLLYKYLTIICTCHIYNQVRNNQKSTVSGDKGCVLLADSIVTFRTSKIYIGNSNHE